jgi:3-phenylpropionate/trans-cinnamate dioxygenase ferredoxin reductase subunit
LAADLVLVGVGVLPNSELAASAGLAVGDGIAVDASLLTDDSHISAIGDCALYPSRFSESAMVRVESVQNATDQGRAVAARLVEKAHAYDATPWFWSDQGDLKLQIAGLGGGHDTAAVRGDPESGAFSVFCFRQGRLVAVESVNRGPDHVMARRLLAASCPMDAAQAADESVPLKAHLAAAAGR